MIILHIILAVSSLILSSINLFSPSTNKTIVSYSLATGTLATGVLLIVINNASVIRTCMSGVLFFGAVTIMNQIANRKLATQLAK